MTLATESPAFTPKRPPELPATKAASVPPAFGSHGLAIGPDRLNSSARLTDNFILAARVGFWSALLATGASLVFSTASVPVLLGAVAPPWADVLTLGPSLVLAPALLVLLVCVCETAPAGGKLWAHLAVAFGGAYVTLVCTVYVVALAVVEPLIVRGEAARAGLLTIDRGGALNAMDGLGYTFLCLATLFAAPLFSGDRLRRWIHWLLLANTAAALPIVLTYFVDRAFVVIAGPVWSVAISGATVLLAVLFWRLEHCPTAELDEGCPYPAQLSHDSPGGAA